MFMNVSVVSFFLLSSQIPMIILGSALCASSFGK